MSYRSIDRMAIELSHLRSQIHEGRNGPATDNGPYYEHELKRLEDMIDRLDSRVARLERK